MNKKNYIYWFTLLGIISILALQSIWLYHTYVLIRKDLYKECGVILDKALKEEIDNLADKLDGTEIFAGPEVDTIPLSTYLYDGLWKLGIRFPLSEIDSIAGIYLKKANIDSDYLICSVNPNTKEIYEKSKDLNIPRIGAVKSEVIPMRLDFSHGVQLVLKNPYNTIFERMGLLMIATAIMMIFVVRCIFYQVGIVIRLKKIFQIREDFSHAMVHDMKSPLSTLILSLKYLQNPKMEDKPEAREHFYKMAQREAEHLLSLTNRILTLVKLETHKLDITKKNVALAPMIGKLIDKFSIQSHKPIQFTTDLKATEVYADEGYLEEVLSNLIDNAIKYSKDNIEIKISSLADKQDTIIKVYDNGLGIPKKDQRIIFKKFERSVAAKRSQNGGASGFGIGLNFVYQVIKAHEGDIIVNSIENEYSEFVIYLPNM